MTSDRWQILQVAARLVKWVQLGSLGSKWGFGTVQGPPADPAEGEEDTSQPARYMSWFGFRSAPVLAGGEGIVVAPRGGSSNATVIATDNLGLGPTDLKEGEVAVFDKAGSVIRLYEDGSIRVVGKAGNQILVDKDGNVDVLPSPSGSARLGTNDPAKLSHVAVFESLKVQFDALAGTVNGLILAYNAHVHGPPGTPPTATFPGTASNLTSQAASPNVLARDRI